MPQNRVLMPFKAANHKHQRCLDSALSGAEENCRARGVRLTKLRRRVLELVWTSHEPIKAYDILEHLRQEHSGSAPPTVYRALDFLQVEGLVHKIETLNAYVGCGEPEQGHSGQFLICQDCGAVAEMDDFDIKKLLASKAGAIGFHVSHETIEVRGLCATCQTTGT